MSEQPLISLMELPSETTLENRFPDFVTPDNRIGYEGILVKPEKLVEIATVLRDEIGFDFLSSVTAVDYLPENKMEVVYHAFKSIGGPGLVFKVQVPRANPVVPSLVSVYPGADLQEREAWDLMGIQFDGHSDLRRILTWEGFHGHPLQKDWHEPYYEQENKPFRSRWPEGQVHRSEEDNPFNKNVAYPKEFDPDSFAPNDESRLYASLKESIRRKDNSDLITDTLLVNMGPQHPSTHGVFRVVVALEGETVLGLKPVMGYLHRNHEKIGERNTYLMNMPFTDRLDYFSSMSNNFGYALAVEKLLGIKPTERADYLRIIMAEFTRICNHLLAIGFFLNDLGAYFTPVVYAFEEREFILDIFEAVAGSRMMCNYFRFGGVCRDLPEGVLEKIRKLVYDRLPRKIDELDLFLTNNEIVRSRTESVGVLTPEQAIAFSESGPVLRASGVPYDIRRADPYGIYERFDFDVAVRYHGDSYDRYLIRIDEMRQSVRILQQAVRDLPAGPVLEAKPPYQVMMPIGEAYGRVEGPKGELGYYLVSDGSPNPWRYHIRAPSFINLTAFETMCIGQKVADLVIILGSIDIVLGEVDR
jgi:NADH-quinone oxidoreductase subunit C/D